MVSEVQNLNFTRYIYGLKYACANTFNEFKLLNRIDMWSTLGTNRYEMALLVQIEPFKGVNSKTKGAKLYFRNCFPHDPKDETGMFRTTKKNHYWGNLKFLGIDGVEKKVLVLFQIDPNNEQLIVDVFDNYLPLGNKEQTKVIDAHVWHKKSTL